MHIIKLDAIDSTNTYLKDMISKQYTENFTTVVTNCQTNGRGQMGTNWTSEASKNLTFSVFVDISDIKLEYPFYISMLVSLAVRKTLYMLMIPQLSIKWPNDILSHHKKICGILIENVIKQGVVTASIIGIGLNVNQTEFMGLPNASSLKNLTGRLFDLDEVLNNVISNLRHYMSFLRTSSLESIKNEYESFLFRKNKPSTFKDTKGNLFSGYIQSVENTGNISILLEDNVTKSFALKDISLLY
ncbi:biotin--[acetyl-CoA-carboxylase] ligase [Flavobacteriaceae bacterium MHTCC 0001]